MASAIVHREHVEVSVIIPVHNAADFLLESIQSALQQRVPDPAWPYQLAVHVCCYDDGSTDDSWTILQKIRDKHNNTRRQRDDDDDAAAVYTRLCIEQSTNGVSRGAGYARNRAVDMLDGQLLSNTKYQFLCMLDSDDVMHPNRVYRQCRELLAYSTETRHETLLGCTFDRDPPDSTWHYAQWANGLSDERLYLEQFREVTLLQPTWMLTRDRFRALGGYLEAPLPTKSRNVAADYFSILCDNSSKTLQLVHPDYETACTLRVAEDLRLFHAHLAHGGRLQLLRYHHHDDPPLLTYRHRLGQSQSSQTPRKLLLQLRARALELRVLNNKWSGPFCVWGAGRDGKDFVKALSKDCQRRVYAFLEVDNVKIAHGSYTNRELRIPIIHFSLAARDNNMARAKNLAAFGRIEKSQSIHHGAAIKTSASNNKRRMLPAAADEVDVERLSAMPVVVCVSMHRTGGALEHNVSLIGRTEGKDLWHFS